jgi:hypothetical protein
MEGIDAALAEIDSLDPGEQFSYVQIAKKHGVNRTTLARRHQRVQAPRAEANRNQPKLTPQQEEELVAYIRELTGRHSAPTREMIRNFASAVADSPCSDRWVSRFLNRHHINLISKWVTGMDSNRHHAESEDKYRMYFDLLYQKIVEYDLEPAHTYNMDEKGFAIGVLGRSKRIFDRRAWEKGEVRQSLQDGNREWVSLLACICADGTALPPGIIFASKNSTIQARWVAEIDPETQPIHVTSSPTGWTNNDIGLAWLTQVFDRYTKRKALQNYRLLIVDGHGSHLTREFLEYCHQNRIIIAILPPHSTQTLQPLDVVCFKPLSLYYTEELSKYLHESQGLSPIGKTEFLSLFWRAWTTTFTQTLVLSAFTATGISPPNADVILNRFRHTSQSCSPSISSGTSAYSGDEWLKACSLLRAEVKDPRSRGARKLGQTIHHLSIQNELLNEEIIGLRKTLHLQRKKKKQPNKQLDLPLNQEYHGGAMLWSPHTFRQARARMAQQAEEQKAEELKKAEIKKLKAANKIYQEKIAEEKRAQRLREKEERAQAKAVKDAEVAERRAEKQREKETRDAQKAIQLPKTGKRKASQSAVPRKKQKRGGRGSGSRPAAPERSPTPPPTFNRHGRKIALPKRFE